jgi:type I restriction enzyme S subunit
MLCWFSPRELKDLSLRKNDLLIAEGGSVGRCAVLSEDLVEWGFQKSLNRVRVRGDDDIRFLSYLIRHATECGHVAVLCGRSTIQHFTADKLANLDWPHPSPAEQRAIADFLDAETAKIDALIGKQEQLIATLREDRTATITHAVTKGLDPGVVMQDSGVEWLGEIPCHWETTRLGWVADKIIDCAHSTPTAFDQGEYTVVRSGSIRDGKYRPEFSFQTDRDTYLERVERGVPTPGDIFFTREAPAGEACLVPGLKNLCLGQRMVLLKINNEAFLPDLVVRAIYSRPVMAYFDVQLNGSTVGNLKMDRIAKTPLPNPPIEDQRRIVAFLNERCEKIDALIAKANEVIGTLREYRSALITDAVTGKIDPREAVA